METDAATVQGGDPLEVKDEHIGKGAPNTSKDSPKADKSESKSQPKGEGGSPTPEAKEKGPGPWDAKLTELGLNDPKFSDFIRSEIQPYITQLEQGDGVLNEYFGGDQEAAELAAGIFQQIINSPEDAYRELGELLGVQDADLGDDEVYDDGEDGDYEDDEGYDDPRAQWIDEQIRREQEGQEDSLLEDHLDDLRDRIPGFDDQHYVELLLAYQGDHNRALQSYMSRHRDPDPTPTAPNVLGDGGGTAPPEANQPKTIDDAVNAFLAQDRARR